MTSVKEVSNENVSTGNGNNYLIEHEELKQAVLYTEEEREAIRQKAISDGCLVEPLVVWGSKKYLVWGYSELSIAKERNLFYETKELEFKSITDCLAWIGEKRMAVPTLNSFQKTEIGLVFWSYWKDKDEAKYAAKSPLKIAAMKKNGRADKSTIIGIKAGISHNTVYKVCQILDSKNKDLIEQCREGELSINAAHQILHPKDSNKDPNEGDTDKKQAQREKQQKQKEVDTLAKYCSVGFSSAKEKLDEHGLKFFVYRWNDEHPNNKITKSQVKKAIEEFKKN